MWAYVLIGTIIGAIFLYELLDFLYKKGVEHGRLEAEIENLKKSMVVNNEISNSLNDNINDGANSLIDELHKNS